MMYLFKAAIILFLTQDNFATPPACHSPSVDVGEPTISALYFIDAISCQLTKTIELLTTQNELIRQIAMEQRSLHEQLIGLRTLPYGRPIVPVRQVILRSDDQDQTQDRADDTMQELELEELAQERHSYTIDRQSEYQTPSFNLTVQSTQKVEHYDPKKRKHHRGNGRNVKTSQHSRLKDMQDSSLSRGVDPPSGT